ncbi:MAG: methylated-DNA--[protein]-cysteine S-methyltransferase [Planctomycetota bacterium]|jgi:methylated-DNA-[protein]-cysteine S-methyltransferase
METMLVASGTRFFSPVGELGLRGGPRGLAEVRWLQTGDAWPEEQHPMLAQAVAALEQYFSRRQMSLEVPLDLSDLTPFQRRVMITLRTQVLPGQVVTYGELACLAGHPGAARAVGGVMAHNPLPLFVPCHRVVGVRSLGGFGPGLRCKRQLLRHEGFELDI